MQKIIQDQRFKDARLEELLAMADNNPHAVSIERLHELASHNYSSYTECQEDLKRMSSILKLQAVGSAQVVEKAAEALEAINETHDEVCQSLEAQISKLSLELKEQQQRQRTAEGNLAKAKRAHDQLASPDSLPPVIKELVKQLKRQQLERFGSDLQQAQKRLHRAELLAGKLDSSVTDIAMLPEAKQFMRPRASQSGMVEVNLDSWREFIKAKRREIPALKDAYENIVVAMDAFEEQHIAPLLTYYSDPEAYFFVGDRNDF